MLIIVVNMMTVRAKDLPCLLKKSAIPATPIIAMKNTLSAMVKKESDIRFVASPFSIA